MSKKKKIITTAISILIVLTIVIAISYAFFSTVLNGKEQIVKIGSLDLILDETSEGLNLNNAMGVSDSVGMGLTPATFKLINNGTKAVDYTIYLDDNTIGETDIRMADKYLKYNLVKNGSATGAKPLTSMGSNPNRILDRGTIDAKSTNEYTLNIWITSEVDGDYSGQVFSGVLRVEVSQEKGEPVNEVVLTNLGDKGSTYDDGVDTFITGEEPNNYIWYSGKLWRAVSINNKAKTTKLVTQWNISTNSYSSGSSDFEGSYMEDWLNDTSVDGFLGNLREPEKFIVMDAKWNATMDAAELGSITRPSDETGTIVEDAVGLLNMYEYQTSYRGSQHSLGYLNNGLNWFTLTPRSSSSLSYIVYTGYYFGIGSEIRFGVRPSINLKENVKIISGDGTETNPYRLKGDNDSNLSGTLLNTRYSGEYIRFGSGENDLYMIVSHETEGLTKITSVKALKDSGSFKTSIFGDNPIYSSNNAIGTFLNGEYLTNYVGSPYTEMIEENTIWYLGQVLDGSSYKLAKYEDTTGTSLTSNTTTAKVGLLRYGELGTGQYERYYIKGTATIAGLNTTYWLLNSYNDLNVWYVNDYSYIIGIDGSPSNSYGIKPCLNLKSNVVITSGDGTKENPFEIEYETE